jgi:hypothetical protein
MIMHSLDRTDGTVDVPTSRIGQSVAPDILIRTLGLTFNP